MTADVVVLAVTTAFATAVVAYLAWSNYHHHQERERKRDQQKLWQDLQREPDRNETVGSRRHNELQRQLAEHHRILKYLARRLS